MSEDAESQPNQGLPVPAFVEDALALDEADRLLEGEIRERSVIGDPGAIREAYKACTNGDMSNWRRLAWRMVRFGGTGELSHRFASVNTEIFPPPFAEIMLEHEIAEMVYYFDETGKDIDILRTLGLLDGIRDHFRQQGATPLLGHYVGMIYELAEAHRRGLLDEHNALWKGILEGFRGNSADDLFDIQFREGVKKLLEG